MANHVYITADSPCDLPKELIEKYDIRITPLTISLGMDSHLDGIDIQIQDIFDYHARTGDTAKTSAVAPQTYIDLFRELTQDGSEVVHIALSSKISSTCQNAMIAAGEVEGVYVIDSLALHTGMAHLVLEACSRREQGMAAQQIAAEITALVPKVQTTFMVNTLDYLKAGGRCSALTAFGANLLSIKPCIGMTEGSLGVAKKYRGKVDKVYKQYIDDRLADLNGIDTRRVFVSHSALEETFFNSLVDYVKSKNVFDEVLTSVAGCTISTHSGPDAFAVIYMAK